MLLAGIDATSRIEREDEWVFDAVRRSKRPAILAVNKVDAVKKPLVLPLLEQCAGLKLFEELIPISALAGDNLTRRGDAAWYVGPTQLEQLEAAPMPAPEATPCRARAIKSM